MSELALYHRRLGAVARRFHELFAQGRLLDGPRAIREPRHIGKIVPSYLHMMNNRLGVTVEEESYLSVLIHLTLAAKSNGARRRQEYEPTNRLKRG